MISWPHPTLRRYWQWVAIRKENLALLRMWSLVGFPCSRACPTSKYIRAAITRLTALNLRAWEETNGQSLQDALSHFQRPHDPNSVVLWEDGGRLQSSTFSKLQCTLFCVFPATALIWNFICGLQEGKINTKLQLLSLPFHSHFAINC